MKKLVLISALFLISSCSSQNLTLVCNGTLVSESIPLKTEVSKKMTKSYTFKDGAIKDRFVKSECNWDKEEILCLKHDEHYEKQTSVTFDRISGMIKDRDSFLGYYVDTFTGKCEKGSVQF